MTKFEARLIENALAEGLGFSAHFPTLELAIGFAQKPPSIKRKEPDL